MTTDRAREGFVSEELFLELLEKRELKTVQVPGLQNLPKGGAVVYVNKEVSREKFGGRIGVAVMVSPQVVQVYAEKLYCGWLASIVANVHDPTVIEAADS